MGMSPLAGLWIFRGHGAVQAERDTSALRFCEPHRNLPTAIEIAPGGASKSSSVWSKLSRAAAQ